MISGADDDLAILGYLGAISPSVGADYGLGYDDVGADYGLGAARPVRRAPSRQVQSRAMAAAGPARQALMHQMSRLQTMLPGVPDVGPRFQPLPLLSSAFTATSGTSLPFNPTPQRAFRGRRLVYVETRTGATATGLVTIQNFAIGTKLQGVQAGALPAGAFAPNAFDTDMSLDPCDPGVTISGNVVASAAPTMTDRIDFSLGLWGESAG